MCWDAIMLGDYAFKKKAPITNDSVVKGVKKLAPANLCQGNIEKEVHP